MKIFQVLQNLKHYNSWRKGELDHIDLSPREVSITLDETIKLLEKQPLSTCRRCQYSIDLGICPKCDTSAEI